METISGGPSEEFLPDTILQAAKLNKALENWVVTEVPGEDEGEIGDVVFVTGPGDGGSGSSTSTAAPGLVHLHTESFSAVSSVILDNVFSSEYENYRLILNTNQTDVGQIWGRFRSGGVTDSNTANYFNQWLDVYSTNVDSDRQANPTGILLAYRNGSGTAYSDSIIYEPNANASTKAFTNAVGATSNWSIQTRVSSHASGVQDGIEIKPSAGTFGGTVRIYGYSKGGN